MVTITTTYDAVTDQPKSPLPINTCGNRTDFMQGVGPYANNRGEQNNAFGFPCFVTDGFIQYSLSLKVLDNRRNGITFLNVCIILLLMAGQWGLIHLFSVFFYCGPISEVRDILWRSLSFGCVKMISFNDGSPKTKQQHKQQNSSGQVYAPGDC